MHKLYGRLTAKLTKRKNQGNLRKLAVAPSGIDFASNDYLGHARSASLHESTRLCAPAHLSGLGSTGSRLLTGNSLEAMELEQELSRLFRAKAALLFNSGYDLNLGLLQALGEKGDVILMDEFAHASLKDGLKLSQAAGYFFRHNDLDHLARKLNRLSLSAGHGQTFVVVESVYSMDGDTVPLAQIVELCEKFGAALIIDEAHGVGTLGAWGEGLVSARGYEDRVFARVHTFGKAVGVHGAALLGPALLIEYMLNFCHSFIYTTALPQHSILAIRASLARMHADPSGYHNLKQNIQYFNGLLQLVNHPTPIYSFVFSDTKPLKLAAADMGQKGLLCLPVFSPTVKKGSERLRVCLHSYNTRKEIDRLWSVLKKYERFWEKPLCDRH